MQQDKLEASLRELFMRSGVLELIAEEAAPPLQLLRNETALLHQQVRELYQAVRQSVADEDFSAPYELVMSKGEAMVILATLPIRMPTKEQAEELLALYRGNHSLVFDFANCVALHLDWLGLIEHLRAMAEKHEKTVRSQNVSESIKSQAAKHELEIGLAS